MKIKDLYSSVSKGAFVDDSYMGKIINLCIEDIGLAHDVLRYQKDIDVLIFGKEYSEYYYYSFIRLAVIYEKQKRYQEAIRICENAIRLKATNDGTKGGMKGRLERLKKKEKTSKDTEIT